MGASAKPNSDRLKTLALCAGVFVLALGVRAWTLTWLTDFWGDSYHHWLITRLTMQNGGVYSDYKGLEVVWSPLYHYVSMLPLWLSGRTDIVPLHWMNSVLGALACALAAYVAWRMFANRAAALAAGAVLAVMTWHIAFSGMNVAEVFSGVLILAVVLLVLCKPEAAQRTEPSVRSMLWQRLSWARVGHWFLLLLLAVAMPLTRTDLSVYLGIIVLWLWIQKRYADAVVIAGGVVLALGAWSLWSYVKTGNFLYWYQEYAKNNLHDWLLLNPPTTNPAFAFADYLNRLSPLVLPTLWGGVLSAVTWQGAARRNIWLVTALLAGHALFLIVGYTRGIVPLLTERYLALDLPLVAVLVGGLIVLVGDGVGNVMAWIQTQLPHAVGDRRVTRRWGQAMVAAGLVVLTLVRFWNDMPELAIRRWGIDPEWQIGNYLYAQVQPGDVVLTDAPVAIYRSGKPLAQFISTRQLKQGVAPLEALALADVDWIVSQPQSYDVASSYIPRALLETHTSGTVEGVRFEPVWRYDPQKTDIQSEVWHVIQEHGP